MSATIRIVRAASLPAITLEEWRDALRSTPGIRPNETPIVARDPRTGRELTIPADPDVAEVLDLGEWIPLVVWEEGAGWFYPPPDDQFGGSEAMAAVRRLAERLGATVQDERTGDVA
jgi:hypothetical protein